MQELQLRLNPYCSGQWSSTDGKISKFLVIGVLILVVVDNGLVPTLDHHYPGATSLNPYCSGQWSSTIATYDSIHVSKFVLILAVVEDGLVHNQT